MEHHNDGDSESGEPRSEHQALVASLHAAVAALTTCVESIYDLIEHVDAISVAEASRHPRRRARVSYGGGVSPLVSFDPFGHSSGRLASARPAAVPVVSEADEDGPAGPPGGTGTLRGVGRPGAAALMAATDLAHRGYSQEEIAERMRDRWGDEAGQILRDLME